MFCYNCGRHLSEHDYCTACGADVKLYKKIMSISNLYYNEGLEKASVRDLSGAVVSLRQSLKFNKNNIDARNLLGLVYFEMGEVVAALSEWVISKNTRPDKNMADDYISRLQANGSKMEALNQTIKKYNQALSYCRQDSKDLAVIQLKKVLSMNSRFVRAHQLLALLYMDSEEWERAERELRKCADIDKNNTMTMRYMKEVEAMLVPDDNLKQPAKHKKEEAVRYSSDNEIIIQPLNVKEPKNTGVSTFFNIVIGLAIGIAATYFLLVPSAKTNAKNEAQKTITEISNQLDSKTSQILELQGENDKMREKMNALENDIEEIVGTGGTIQSYDGLLTLAGEYIENGDLHATADSLAAIAESIEIEATSESFQELYNTIFAAIGPQLSTEYYDTAREWYRSDDYTKAIENFLQAVYYDSSNEEAYYYLARSYHKLDDTVNAIATYKQVLDKFPEGRRVSDATRYLKELGVTE